MVKVPSRRRKKSKKQPILGSAVFFVLCVLILLAPLVRGGNRQIALIGLTVLGVMLLVMVAIRGTFWLFERRGIAHQAPAPDSGQSRWVWFAFACLAFAPLWIGALQLLPLSTDVWASLAGRAPYLQAAGSVGLALPTSLALSLNPQATAASMLAGLPAGAAFIAALTVTSPQAKRLMWLVIFVSGVQAVSAVLQLVGGPGSAFFFELSDQGSIVGTFANRNHFAQLLALSLPATLYVWLFSISEASRPRGTALKWHEQGGVRALFFGFMVFSWVVLILFSTSRGASLAMVLNLVICAALVYRVQEAELSPIQKWGALFAVVATIAVIAVFVELDRLSVRIDSGVLASDADKRWRYAVSAFQGSMAFWPWGSGMGTFESAFPRFQAVESAGLVHDAHNDYAQLLMELGILAPLLALAVLVLSLRQLVILWPEMKRRTKVSESVMLRLFAGVGLLGLAVHSWAEFNLYIPALAINAGLLLGLYLRPLPIRQGSDGSGREQRAAPQSMLLVGGKAFADEEETADSEPATADDAAPQPQ